MDFGVTLVDLQLSFIKSFEYKKFLTKNWSVILLVLLGAVLCFVNLNAGYLSRWDEKTNYWVVEESLHQGNLLKLKLKSENFFEKPPLWYYATGAVVSVIGHDIYVYRLISAVSGLGILVILIHILQRKYNQRTALVGGAAFLAVGQNFVTDAGNLFSTHTYRSADLDPLQIFLILAAFWVYFMLKSPKRILLSAALLGIGALVKGPVVAIPFLILLWLDYRSKQLNKFHLLALVLLGGPFATWLLVMVWKFGSPFITKFIEYHVLSRTLIPLEGHEEGWYFYFQVLFNFARFSLWPMLLVALVALRKKILKDDFLASAVAMVVLTLIAFTIVSTKLSWYTLPIYPFAAIIIAVATNHWHKKLSKINLLWLSLVYIGIVLGIASNVYYVFTR